MSTKILQKCVDELRKEQFSKEFVLGMLETLIDMSGQTTVTTSGYMQVVPQSFTPSIESVTTTNDPPVITGFKDLIPKEEINNEQKNAESAYLGGSIGRI